MVVARFRRAKRCRRGGQRAIDDGKRWLQRDSSENRVSGNRTFLSTWDGSPKSSGQPKRIGSCANGGASGAGAGRAGREHRPLANSSASCGRSRTKIDIGANKRFGG